jgi:hypothetical protein
MRVSLNEDSQSIWQSQNLEHLRYEYDLKPDDVVIDLGAYRGEWANEIHARYGCPVIAVEPTDAIDGYDGEIIKQAAGTEKGIAIFGGAYYYTSQYEPGAVPYETFDINTLLDRFADIGLLKINIEGVEYALLQHIIDHNYHQRIRNLQVQFHLIEGQPWQAWYDGIAGLLERTHFTTYRYPFCWENWERREAMVELDEDYVERLNA